MRVVYFYHDAEIPLYLLLVYPRAGSAYNRRARRVVGRPSNVKSRPACANLPLRVTSSKPWL